MRIATVQVFQGGLNSMLDQQTRVYKTQLQLGTGKQFASPADNPTAAAQVLGLNETLAVTGQYKANITSAISRLELSDEALNTSVNVLQRARELAVRGLNGSLGADERRAVAQEVRQLGNEMMALANSQDGNGDYMYAGSRVQGAPFSDDGSGTFSYAGDQAQRNIQIGAGRQIEDGDSGFDVFMKVPSTAGGYEDVFSTLYTLATDLEANTPQLNSLAQLDNGIEHLLQVRSSVGARLNSIDNQQEINSFLEVQLAGVRSKVQDLDIAEAYSRLTQETLVLQSAQAAYTRVAGLSLFNYL
jgi:flagellar hook-associated protein 3 FlgL